MTNDELLLEVSGTIKKVLRAGKLVTKHDCPDGYKVNRTTGKCDKMTNTERMVLSKRAKLAAKKGKSKRLMALKKRAKTLLKRKSLPTNTLKARAVSHF